MSEIVWGRRSGGNVKGVIMDNILDEHKMGDIDIVINERVLKAHGQLTCSVIWTPYICISSDLCKQPKPIIEALLWHEYGHIYNKTHLGHSIFNDSELKNHREENIKRDQVSIDELKADEFALKMVDKSALIEALNYLKHVRSDYLNSQNIDVNNDLGLKEIDLRIHKLLNVI